MSATILQKPFALCLVLFLLSCNNPEARLERLQHDFREEFARQEYFEVRLKNEVLNLPLPPIAPPTEQKKQLALGFQKEANSIERGSLNDLQQKQLVQICAALNDLVVRDGNSSFDPARYSMGESLKKFSDHPELPVLIDSIPAYYAQVWQRWQTPEVRFVSKAVEESQTALDLLHSAGEKYGSSTVSQAKASVKDFIGLCQSAWLEE